MQTKIAVERQHLTSCQMDNQKKVSPLCPKSDLFSHGPSPAGSLPHTMKNFSISIQLSRDSEELSYQCSTVSSLQILEVLLQPKCENLTRSGLGSNKKNALNYAPVPVLQWFGN